jgi:MazG family protein
VAVPAGAHVSRQFEDLVALQARLLGPHGCPWDREQTHASLRSYLLEEAYEVLEALDAEDYHKLPDELGDLLLQIVFHAELARRAGRFAIGDVIEHIHNKMVRRHPHVFGQDSAADAKAVLKNWEQLKAAERRDAGKAEEQASLLDGIPRTLPATLEGYQMTRRAARIGFDWDTLEGVLDKIREEAAELHVAWKGHDQARLEEEIGDLLFAAVNVARFLETDPELALRNANRKFKARFQWMEREAGQSGRKLADVPRDEMETLWNRSKAAEAGRTGGAG